MTRPKSRQGFWNLPIRISDARADMEHMTHSEKGIWIDLVTLVAGQKPIPADLDQLSTIVGAKPGKLDRFMRRHGHLFYEDGDGHLLIEWVEEARAKAAKRSAGSARGAVASNKKQGRSTDPEGRSSDPQGALAGSGCGYPPGSVFEDVLGTEPSQTLLDEIARDGEVH